MKTMKSNIFNILFAAAAALSAGCLASCSDVDIPEAAQSAKVSNLTGSVEGRTVTLNWTLPTAEGQSGVNIYRNNDLMTGLGVVDSYVAKRQPANQQLIYTVKMVYSDGRISEGESFATQLQDSKVAMLLPSDNEADLDDDEAAAVAWFRTTYGESGKVSTPQRSLRCRQVNTPHSGFRLTAWA